MFPNQPTARMFAIQNTCVSSTQMLRRSSARSRKPTRICSAPTIRLCKAPNLGKAEIRESKRESRQDTFQADGGLSSNIKGELSLGAMRLPTRYWFPLAANLLLELVCDMIQELDTPPLLRAMFEVYQLSPGMAKGSMADALRTKLNQQKAKEWLRKANATEMPTGEAP